MLTGKFIYSFDISSYPYIKVEEADEEGKHSHLFYLKPDQFGFSAPSKNKNHPYDTYILKSEVKGDAIKDVGKWVYKSRTIGGSFLWPLEVDQKGKPIDNIQYNLRRGGSCKGGAYIEDRVDLTLLEIMMVLEDRKDVKVILDKYYDKNMRKWLNHFKSFDIYTSFFCFDESFLRVFAKEEKGLINIIDSNIEENNYIELLEEDIGIKRIYEIHRQNKQNVGKLRLNNEQLKTMLNNVNLLIEKRTERMEEIIYIKRRLYYKYQ